MTRDDILAIVTRHICEAGEGLSPSAIDSARSMKDFGLSSLDVVEVVSRSMRELKVTVPRSDLRHLSNINGLVDLLHRSIAARNQEEMD
jgi:acyl carrier protein